MCGRFTNRLTWREIVALYRLSVPLTTPERNLPARYNICPTDPIDVIIERNGVRELVTMRWGLTRGHSGRQTLVCALSGQRRPVARYI